MNAPKRAKARSRVPPVAVRVEIGILVNGLYSDEFSTGGVLRMARAEAAVLLSVPGVP